MVNTLERARKPLQKLNDFYEDGSGIKTNSFNAYLEMLKQLQRPAADAHFIFEKVFILADLSAAQTHGKALFKQSLTKHLPEYEEQLPAKFLDDIYNNLYTFIKDRINEPIT